MAEIKASNTCPLSENAEGAEGFEGGAVCFFHHFMLMAVERNRCIGDSSSFKNQGSDWAPAVDIYRKIDGWMIKVDLAGIQFSDIKVAMENSRLKIEGTRRDWCVKEGYEPYTMEIAYNRFGRVIDLPEERPQTANTRVLQTEYRDGMLMIAIRDKESSGS